MMGIFLGLKDKKRGEHAWQLNQKSRQLGGAIVSPNSNRFNWWQKKLCCELVKHRVEQFLAPIILTVEAKGALRGNVGPMAVNRFIRQKIAVGDSQCMK
jgi:hypothetical protein